MILFDYFRSSAAYRVRIALNLKGLAYEHRSVNLQKGEESQAAYTSLNPQALVPTLLIEGAGDHGSDIRLTQSLAICDYLDSHKPDPALLPEEPVRRADIQAFALAIACDVHPLNNLRVLQYLTGELGVDDQAKLDWYHHWVAMTFEALEAGLNARPQDNTGSAFCFGDAPTLADVCLVPQVFNAQRFDVPLQHYPNILRIHAHCQQLTAFADAHPTRQPDAPKSA